MKYLAIHYAPFVLDPGDASVRTLPAMREQWIAQSAAMAEIGFTYRVAAMAVSAAHPAAAACTSPPFVPDSAGFELLPLPYFHNAFSYTRIKAALAAALRSHIALADIVQMDCDGEPVMLGEIAWPIAGARGARRAWNFGADEPFAPLRAAFRGRNIVRRLVRERLIRRRMKFCRQVVADADAVFSQHPAIDDVFADVWNERCHRLDPALFSAADVASDDALQHRASRASDKNRPLCFAVFAPHEPAASADHMIRALAHCRRLSVPIDLAIIGDAAAAGPILKIAGELAMADFVRRIEPVGDAATRIRQLDACDALLSVATQGIVETEIFAALAAGCGAVAYDNPATNRLIESTGAGRIVPAENVLLLAQAMIDLHRNRAELAKIGQNARNAAVKRTWEWIEHKRAVKLREMWGMTKLE